MRRASGRSMAAFTAGVIGLGLILVLAYLGFTKDIPFTRPYELNAVFQNAPPIGTNTAVRIAGVEVGKVSKVEPVSGDSPGVRVTMKLKDDALPIHEDAVVEARERIFLEGNMFLAIKPGSPSAPEIEDGGTVPVSRTSAPVQLDQVLGLLQTNTRKDLQDLLAGYGEALNGQPAAGRGHRPGRGHPGRDRRPGAQRLARVLRGRAARRRRSSTTRRSAAELHDISKLIAGQQKIFGALSSREGSLKELLTNFNVTMGALAAEQDNLSRHRARAAARARGRGPALDSLNAAFPSTRAWALRDDPRRPRDAGDDRGRLPVGAPDARTAAPERAAGPRGRPPARGSRLRRSSPTARCSCCPSWTCSTAARATWCCRVATP